MSAFNNKVLLHHMKFLRRQPVISPFDHGQAALFQDRSIRIVRWYQAQSSAISSALLSFYRATTLLLSGLISPFPNHILSEVSDTEGSVALRVSSLGLAMNCSGVQTPFGHTTYGASARPSLQGRAHGAPNTGSYI